MCFNRWGFSVLYDEIYQYQPGDSQNSIRTLPFLSCVSGLGICFTKGIVFSDTKHCKKEVILSNIMIEFDK